MTIKHTAGGTRYEQHGTPQVQHRLCHWCYETATVEWREHDFTERACAFHADKWCPAGYVRHAV